MFDTTMIGRRIAALRKEKGLSQMELADAMGISFQSVSNWERGNTMPDISRLPELAGILGVTVDGLLGGTTEAEVIEKAMDESTVLSLDEFKEVAPLLKPEQARRRFDEIRKIEEKSGGGQGMDVSDLVMLSPFLDDDVLSELADNLVAEGQIGDLAGIAPFLGQEKLDALAKKIASDQTTSRELIMLAPFMSKAVLSELTADALQQGVEAGGDASRKNEEAGSGGRGMNASDLVLLAPFLDEDALNELADNLVAAECIGDLTGIAPFLGQDKIDALVKRLASNKTSSHELIMLAPFMSKEALSGLTAEAVRHSVDRGETLCVLEERNKGEDTASSFSFLRINRKGKDKAKQSDDSSNG